MFDCSVKPKSTINHAQSAKNEPKVVVNIQNHVHFDILGSKQKEANSKNEC